MPPQDMGDEVVDKYERWLEFTKSMHGPTHPAVSFASSSLAGVLLEQVIRLSLLTLTLSITRIAVD